MLIQSLFLLIFITLGGTSTASSYDQSLAKGIQLPLFNILGQLDETGATIFKPLSSSCFVSSPETTSSRHFTYYTDTKTLYTVLTTTTNLHASLGADYSLGFTLDASSKGISGSDRTVSGNSLIITASSKKIMVDKTCVNQASFADDFMFDLNNLPLKIPSPWLISSWKLYDVFLKKYGSHIVSAITLGSMINQMAFSETRLPYSERDFQVKSCMALSMPMTDLSLCTNVTNEEISRVTTLTMSDQLTVTGGTTSTRNELLQIRTAELIEQFMNEANATDSPIRYTFTPIWQIIQANLISETDGLHRGINLEYYYRGFLNYGCSYKYETGQALQKFDLVSGTTSDSPQYECSLAPAGCHSNSDCHYKPIWCSCRGSSCVRYEDVTLDTGTIKTTAYMNTGEDWGWQGCDWKVAGSKCYCAHESYTRRIVWSGDNKDAIYKAHEELLEISKGTRKSAEHKREL